MELQQLKAFYYAAKYNSLSKAANQLFCTQPNISQHIKKLENEFSVSLVYHSQGKCVVSKEGEELYKLIEPIIVNLESVKLKFEERINRFKNQIKIMTFPIISQYRLPPVIKKYLKKFPYSKYNTEIIIHDVSIEDIPGKMNFDAFDFLIAPDIKLDNNDVTYLKWYEGNLLLFALKNHPINKIKNVCLKDIAKYPLIVPEENTHGRIVIDNAFKKNGVKYDVSLESSDASALKRYIEMGLGIGITSEATLKAVSHSNLVTRKLKELEPVEIFIIIKKGKFITPAVSRFLEMLNPDWKDIEV